MCNQWQNSIAKKYSKNPLKLLAYASRLIGQDPRLVLHGGGNTSIKCIEKNILGEEQPVLYIKASGVDMVHIQPHDFVPMNLHFLQKLEPLSSLSDEQLEWVLNSQKLSLHPASPSVETVVHAFFPHPYIYHTHADCVLTLTNQKNGAELIKHILGNRVGVLPYIRPGFNLAKKMNVHFNQNPDINAIVVENHGIFVFEQTAKAAYDLMIEYIRLIENYIEYKQKPMTTNAHPTLSTVLQSAFIQSIRGACAISTSDQKYDRVHISFEHSPEILALCNHVKTPLWCQNGSITPDHTIRTQNSFIYLEPCEDLTLFNKTLRDQIDRYKNRYTAYVNQYDTLKSIRLSPFDKMPRVFVIKDMGIIGIGATRKEAVIATDIALHNLSVKYHADEVGEYQPISEQHIFEMEFWPLQRKKLKKDGPCRLLSGQIAFVSGAGGAIGLGIADRLLAAGVLVILSDIDKKRLKSVHQILSQKYDPLYIHTMPCDVTRFDSVCRVFETICLTLGGLDILVPNAGLAHVASIETLSETKFKQLIDVNLMGSFNLIKAAIPIFKQQDTRGNIVCISSKNVFDPGASFGAYSASKAASHQLSRIAALELAELGVRVNMVNPDAIFGSETISSKLWDLVGPDRMKARNLDPQGLKDYYKNRNLLKTEVLAEHVGNAVVFFASNQTPTTGATLPVDGGIPAAAPR